MNKKFIGLGCLGAFVVGIIVIGMWIAGQYNGMVKTQEEATTAWANVQSTYQRRADLIGNLVDEVISAVNYNKTTLENVINARARASQVTIDPTNATPEQMAEFAKAQGELNSALGRFMVIKEEYPDLNANPTFQNLEVQLEGSNNRCNEARMKYNTAVQTYNTKIRSFPATIFAGMFGFDKMSKFEAEAGAMKNPDTKDLRDIR
ncbi:MAG: LemA family protein [Prevotella sp.]|nr:LemA family protein [Prevotella sp.]